MATFLDLSTTLSPFSAIFVFLFVLILAAAFMYYTKLFGGNQMFIWAIAFILAIFVAMSKIATEIIQNIAPIFVIVLVFTIIISIVGSSMIGHSTPDSISGLKWIVLVILVIALIVGTLATLREKIDVPEPGEESYEKTTSVIFHPNFIGLVLFFLIAVFTVGLLASKSM